MTLRQCAQAAQGDCTLCAPAHAARWKSDRNHRRRRLSRQGHGVLVAAITVTRRRTRSSANAGSLSFDRDAPAKFRFASDSLLEGAGFEPSVPRLRARCIWARATRPTPPARSRKGTRDRARQDPSGVPARARSRQEQAAGQTQRCERSHPESPPERAPWAGAVSQHSATCLLVTK